MAKVQVRIYIPEYIYVAIMQIASKYDRTAPKIIEEMLAYTCDDRNHLCTRYARAFDESPIPKIMAAKDAQKVKEDNPAQLAKPAKQVLPNFVISVEKAGRVPPHVLNFIKHYATKNPRWNFDIFYGKSMVRMSAYGTTVEVDVTDQTAFFEEMAKLPVPMGLNSWYEDGTLIFPDQGVSLEGYSKRDADLIAHWMETLIQDNDFHAALTTAEKMLSDQR